MVQNPNPPFVRTIDSYLRRREDVEGQLQTIAFPNTNTTLHLVADNVSQYKFHHDLTIIGHSKDSNAEIDNKLVDIYELLCSSSGISFLNTEHKGKRVEVRTIDLVELIKKLFRTIDDIEKMKNDAVALKGLGYFNRFKMPDGRQLDLKLGNIYSTEWLSTPLIGCKIERLHHSDAKKALMTHPREFLEFIMQKDIFEN